ncbi:hypothetical protein D3C86_1728840 [compost metagenome]
MPTVRVSTRAAAEVPLSARRLAIAERAVVEAFTVMPPLVIDFQFPSVQVRIVRTRAASEPTWLEEEPCPLRPFTASR